MSYEIRERRAAPQWWSWACGALFGLGLLAESGAFAYREHTKMVNAAREAEWFNVCAATGWKTDVCKLSCKPADRTPATEVQP